MKIKELIEKLKKYDEYQEVIIKSDTGVGFEEIASLGELHEEDEIKVIIIPFSSDLFND